MINDIRSVKISPDVDIASFMLIAVGIVSKQNMKNPKIKSRELSKISLKILSESFFHRF